MPHLHADRDVELVALRVERVEAAVVRRHAERQRVEPDVLEAVLADPLLDVAQALLDAPRVVARRADDAPLRLRDELADVVDGVVEDQTVVVAVGPHLRRGDDDRLVAERVHVADELPDRLVPGEDRSGALARRALPAAGRSGRLEGRAEHDLELFELEGIAAEAPLRLDRVVHHVDRENRLRVVAHLSTASGEREA